jgi:hypothetical protein
MSTTEREYNTHPSIVPFHESHAQVKALCGPVRSGKTLACGFEFFLLGSEATAPVRGLVVRESYRQLHDSTRRTLEDWFGGVSTYHKGDERLTLRIPNFRGETLEHELDLRHCRRPEEVTNLLSTEYDFIWLEEPVPAYQMETGVIGAGLPKELFDMALMRLARGGAHRQQIVLSFNPPPRHHWVHQEFFARPADEMAALDYALFRCTPYENAPNLPPGYYQRLLARLGEELARRFVMGEVVTLYPGQRVYTDFYEQLHFVDTLDAVPKVPLVLGFDFGRTPCCVIGQVLPSGRYVVLREVQMWDAGTERLAEYLQSVLKDEFGGFTQWRCWADPSGAYGVQTDESTPFSVLSAKGFDCQPGAESNAARQEAVIQRTQRFIDGKPAVLIDKTRCPLLTEGLLGGYRYPKAMDGQVGAAPLKNKFSHLCDAFAYVCSREFSTLTGAAHAVVPRRRAGFDPLRRGPVHGRAGTWMAR